MSLRDGVFPDFFKHAAVLPIIKKPNLDANIPSSFRPVSLLPFLSKILEKIIAGRLREHMTLCNVDEILQSGFKSLHSTETALLKVSNDLRRSADNNKCSILLNLDLSAAFDTLDPDILFQRLNKYLGISGNALLWFKSYFIGRSQTVYFNDEKSDVKALKYGVPQGSVLGPILFNIYMLPLGIILRRLGLSYHCYADDNQIYTTITNDTLNDKVHLIQEGYSAINNFLSTSFLKLNHDKSELLLIGKPHIVSQIKKSLQFLTLGNVQIRCANGVKNLGVIFDESLSFNQHIRDISKSSLHKLRNLRLIRKHFSQRNFEILVHSFITSRLDYCNSLFSGISRSALRPLQVVQNYAARVVLKRSKFEHSAPLLFQLHWLPIQRRIDYKILLITYKACNNLAPAYITSLLIPANTLERLRSAEDTSLLHIDITNNVTMGDRAFSVYAPKVWNTLPRVLRDAPSLNQFKSLLKTYLFNIEFSGIPY